MPFDQTKLRLYQPACYRICVQGVLNQSWADYFGGLTVTCDHSGPRPVSTLCGLVNDQAVLLGVLNGLYNLGLCLLAVECLQDGEPRPESYL